MFKMPPNVCIELYHRLIGHWCAIYTISKSILVTPKMLPFTFGDRPMSEGQLVTVACAVVEGDTPINLEWLFEGLPISPRLRVSVVQLGEKNMILSISSVEAKHVGRYTCVARNQAGVQEYSADLMVNGTHYLLKYCCYPFNYIFLVSSTYIMQVMHFIIFS